MLEIFCNNPTYNSMIHASRKILKKYFNLYFAKITKQQ